MIWFLCKTCGKKQSRPESESGTLLFCSCGASVRVPFSSTTLPDQPTADSGQVDMPAPLPLRPVPLDIPDALPADSTPPPPSPDPPRPRRYRKKNDRYCWNHTDDFSAGRCSACELMFCAGCLVKLRGKLLCGACKNFRVSGVGKPARRLPLAVTALVASLVAAPVGLTLSLVGAGLFFGIGTIGVMILLTVLALLTTGVSLAVSIAALRKLEGQSRLSGRAIAAAAVSVSLAGVLWCVSVLSFVVARSGGG
ncbi:MAG: hypothetical protein EBV06_04940 [Planctomycetia bacterium]|nr:hypothetical protein [Planctomycetia bacterium]